MCRPPRWYRVTVSWGLDNNCTTMRDAITAMMIHFPFAMNPWLNEHEFDAYTKWCNTYTASSSYNPDASLETLWKIIEQSDDWDCIMADSTDEVASW